MYVRHAPSSMYIGGSEMILAPTVDMYILSKDEGTARGESYVDNFHFQG